MSASEQIEYTVLTSTGKGWETHGSAPDMQTAVRAAERLHASRKFHGIKVDKRFLDSVNQRLVTATIYEKGGAARGSGVGWWLLLAVGGGVAAFAATYLIVLRSF